MNLYLSSKCQVTLHYSVT